VARWLVLFMIAGATALAFFSVDTPSGTHDAPPNAAIPPADLPSAWDDLPLSEFLNRASAALVVRDPELVTYLGLGDALGIGNGALTPLSAWHQRESQAWEAAVLERLRSYDVSVVPESDQLSARVYGWHLEDLVNGHRFADQDYLVHTFITSYPQSLERFLTDVHPIRSARDAADYIHRLTQIPTRYAELIDALGRSEAIRAIPPRFVVEAARDDIERTAACDSAEFPLYSAFAAKLASLRAISSEERDDLLQQAKDIVEDSILPAYRDLVTYLDGLIERASDEAGVWRHVDGDAYYAYLLRHYTTTDLAAGEIHAIGLAEVERVRAEIRSVVDDLGYASTAPLAELFAKLTEDHGTCSGAETLQLCGDLLESMSQTVKPVFQRSVSRDLRVVGGSTSAFYSPGTLDGSRPGLFYAPTEVEWPTYRMPTVTYHEGIPGHHFQTAFAHEGNLPPYRAGLSFTAYAEGWALYAERLAWELGAYEDDPTGNLGRLQDELFRAVRLVVDTGIHALRWSYDEAASYMTENTGLDEEFVRQEVERYAVLPGQATSYKIGMLRILDLRDRAQRELGGTFELAEFHDVVLGEGSLPLPILEELVNEYIDRHTGRH
jgi:uncharacterized protein (DUF885 family)